MDYVVIVIMPEVAGEIGENMDLRPECGLSVDRLTSQRAT